MGRHVFNVLGRGIKKGDKLKVTWTRKELLKTSKNYLEINLKTILGATYDAFSNHSLIPMLNYKVPTEVADKAIRVFRTAAASANKTPITYQEAQTLVNNMVKTATAS